MRSTSCADGRWTLSTTSPSESVDPGRASTFAPAPRYSASGKPDATPAPASTSTSIPAPTIFSTVAGTAATRLSPSTLSFRTATLMRPGARPLAAGDVDLQLVDQPLLLVQHQLNHVAHGDDADHRAFLPDQQVAREVDAHQVRALGLGGGGGDEGEVAAHRFPDRLIALAAARQHVVDELSLCHQTDGLAAVLDRDGTDALLRHEPRCFAAAGRSVQTEDFPRDVALDGRHQAPVERFGGAKCKPPARNRVHPRRPSGFQGTAADRGPGDPPRARAIAAAASSSCWSVPPSTGTAWARSFRDRRSGSPGIRIESIAPVNGAERTQSMKLRASASNEAPDPSLAGSKTMASMLFQMACFMVRFAGRVVGPPVSAAPSSSQTIARAYPLCPANVTSAPRGPSSGSNRTAGSSVGRPCASIRHPGGTLSRLRSEE